MAGPLQPLKQNFMAYGTGKIVNGRKVRASYSHAIADAKKERKRNEAEARNSVYRSLSVEDTLNRIALRPGESKRERARIEGALAQ